MLKNLAWAEYESAEALAALVSTVLDHQVSGALVCRSPLGPRALRFTVSCGLPGDARSACNELADWAATQRWSQAIAVRSPHVYASPTLAALRAEASAVSARRAALDEDYARVKGGEMEVRLDADLDLTACRARIVASACRALGGVGTGVQTGAVDVLNGALRTTHGGRFLTGDLLEDIEREIRSPSRAMVPAREMPGGALPQSRSVLQFLMLNADRSSRLLLEPSKVARQIALFDRIVLIEAHARALGGGDGAAERSQGDRGSALYDLAFDLGLFPAQHSRAAATLEPVILLRYVEGVANRLRAAAQELAPSDPLWSTASGTLRTALSAVGISWDMTFHPMPPERAAIPWAAAPRQPQPEES